MLASKNKIDRGRSFPLAFKDISKIPNVELISLYKGENENDYSEVEFNLKALDLILIVEKMHLLILQQ